MKEAQTDLQRQLQTSQKETRDVQETFERYKDEMADITETVEIATLDKEMAEEKVRVNEVLISQQILKH